MKGEALVELETDYEEVMNLVNTTFLRSNPDLEGQALTLDNYNNKGELSKLVLRERQRELMFEGKRWFDLMRLARRENSTGPLLTYMLKKFSSGSNARITSYNVCYTKLSRFVDYNDSIGVITSSSFLSNRLLDLLDSHIRNNFV